MVPRLTAYVGDLDAASAELAAKGAAVEPLAAPAGGDDGHDDAPLRAARVALPAGFLLDLVQPPPPGRDEDRITEFIQGAADLEGPPTDDLAAAVRAIVAAAWLTIEERLEGVARDKVLATHLLVSQQSRAESPDSPAYWQASAASTLLSSFVGRS